MNKKHIIVISLITLIISVLVIFHSSIAVLNNKKHERQVQELIFDKAYTNTQINTHDTKNSIIKDGEKYGTSKAIGKDHYLKKDYKLSDMKLYTKDGWCYVEFVLTNIGDKKCNKGNCSINISFYEDKRKKKFFTFAMVELPKLDVNESKTIVSRQIRDFTIAYDYSVDY